VSHSTPPPRPEPVRPRPTITPIPLWAWCAVGSNRLLSRYLVTTDPHEAPPACLEYIPQAKGKACELRQLYAVSDDSLDVGWRSYWVPLYADGTAVCHVDGTGPVCCLRRTDAVGTAVWVEGARVVRTVVGDST